VIAGLDLTANKHTIIGVFAWMGALQIAYGLGIVAVAFWYRPLVPLFLGLGLLERLLMSVAAWVTKPSPTGHHPPEHYASLLLIPVLAVFLAMATRSRSGLVS
jgi:thiol:disulfide interchange protein